MCFIQLKGEQYVYHDDKENNNGAFNKSGTMKRGDQQKALYVVI